MVGDAVILLGIAAVAAWILSLLLTYMDPEQPWKKIGMVLIGVGLLFFVLNFLFSLAGRPFI